MNKHSVPRVALMSQPEDITIEKMIDRWDARKLELPPSLPRICEPVGSPSSMCGLLPSDHSAFTKHGSLF
jgi:hypothetical protein